MRSVFDVYLAKKDSPGDEAYATLPLPAGPYEILDALEKVRPDGPNDVDLMVEEYYGYEYLPSQMAGAGTVNGSAASVTPPSSGTVSGTDANNTGNTGSSSSYPSSGTAPSTAVGFNEVTSAMYYSNGSLGTLKIPSISLTVGVYEGTGDAPLLKGAGHFEGTSIWSGNVCVAGHNRGVRNDFGKIHTLRYGDIITFTTVLGTRTYAVTGVSKVSVYDTSGLEPSAVNMITLYTCVMDQPAYRWRVTAVAVDG